jgi:hypothetical protein
MVDLLTEEEAKNYLRTNLIDKILDDNKLNINKKL